MQSEVTMLSRKVLERVRQQQAAYGEGRHYFGRGTESIHAGMILRDSQPDVRPTVTPKVKPDKAKEDP